MDYCDKDAVEKFWLSVNNEGLEKAKKIFQHWCPVSLFFCLVSLIVNLQISFPGKKSSQKNNPSDTLLLHLLLTNCLASVICGLGVLFIKVLPVTLDIITGDCFLLILEIFQISSLIASGLHHVFLSFQHFREGLERRRRDQKRAKPTDPYFVSINCWLWPAFAFMVYFWIIPCQGFRSPECDFTFFLSFRYRLIITVSFGVLAVIVFLNYVLVYHNIVRENIEARATVLQVTSDKKHRVCRSYDQRYYTRHSFCCNTRDAESTLNGSADEQANRTHERTQIGTAIIIFVTYLICWSPRVAWLTLSCMDGCPFPLFDQSVLTRSLIGLITENAIIIKSIVDTLMFLKRKRN